MDASAGIRLKTTRMLERRFIDDVPPPPRFRRKSTTVRATVLGKTTLDVVGAPEDTQLSSRH